MKKKTRNGLLVLVLLLAIGFAAVSTSLIINGTANFNTNDDEFNVYYSNALVNGEQDLSVVTDNQTITFTEEMSVLGEKYVLDYDVTNGSKNYDAALTITCTEGNDYLSVTNEFDVSTNLEATKTRSGKLTLELIRSYVGDEAKEVSVTCTINANAVERDTLSTDEPALDAESQYYVGKEVNIAGETFNVISQTDDTVTMLSANSLGADYRQTSATSNSEYGVIFNSQSASNWEYTPGPKEIDIFTWSPNISTYINEYVSFLKTKIEDSSITGNLITVKELKTLGCTTSDDYVTGEGFTCNNSKYVDWLVNGQDWWTRSAGIPTQNNSYKNIWYVYSSGSLYIRPGSQMAASDYGNGVRPIITISKDALNNL